MDISLPFGLRWAASCCHDATYFITRAFKEQGGTVLNYVDDLGGEASGEQTATQHFTMLRHLLQYLCLKEALHKVSTPAHAMTWLGLQFNTVNMTVIIPSGQMQGMLLLVVECSNKRSANTNQL